MCSIEHFSVFQKSYLAIRAHVIQKHLAETDLAASTLANVTADTRETEKLAQVSFISLFLSLS